MEQSTSAPLGRANGEEQHNTAAIRNLLLAAFAADDLRRFCLDHPQFRFLLDHFGPGFSFMQMIDAVLEQCLTRDLFPDLLAVVREENTRQYEKHAPYILREDERLTDGHPVRVIETRYYEPETVLVPASRFLMGSKEGRQVPEHETPQHVVDLPTYRIGKYPVTNEQYAEFIRLTAHMVAPEASWEGQTPPADKLDHPVSGVTWYDTLAYCEWLSEQTGRRYSLPAEAQWEKAARGSDGRAYPWGNKWDDGRCNHGSKQTTPVDAYPEGVSPYGCYDMVGNVREWTSTLWGEKLRSPDRRFCYPWANDHREDLTASHYTLRVFRGGGAADRIEGLRCSARGGFFPDRPGPPRRLHGFRVVLL